MLQAAAAGSASNTELTQPASGRASRPPARPLRTGRSPKGPRVTGEARESVRQTDRPVIETEHGITVYPPQADGEPRPAYPCRERVPSGSPVEFWSVTFTAIPLESPCHATAQTITT
jgi:hypothetical protein